VSESNGTYRLAVDIGGTFTDLQLLDEDKGVLVQEKVPTTRGHLADGVIDGIKKIRERAGAGEGKIDFLLHGTTIVTNALLEESFDPAGLVISKGYRGLLEYGRVYVRGPFGTWMFYQPPNRVIPLENVLEAPGRLDREGTEVTPLDTERIAAIAETFREREIASVAVSLMWSFVNDAHERAVKDIFAKVYPECDVALSRDIFPEIREFERAFTTALTAAVRPSVSAYFDGLESKLEAAGVKTRVMSVKSSGGVMSSAETSAHPVEIALSGPAAGVLGMSFICNNLDYDKAITFDMGGTSTDISYIENGTPSLTTEGRIGEYPIHVPIVDIHTIGAGGGSIAWVGAGGKAHVGPRSSGSQPGPAAYGRGGTEATVTDANVVLGRLPSSLIEGDLPLDLDAAKTAVTKFGEQIGVGMVEAALTILELASHNMEMAIREVSTRRGRDPRECVLVGFGGAGPGHVCRLAELLGVPTVLLPTGSGVGSTLGLLVTDVRRDVGRSVLIGMDAEDREARIASAFGGLATDAWETLDRESVPDDRRELLVSGGFRYAKQQYTIDVPISRPNGSWDGAPGESDLKAAIDAFHVAHNELCGFDYRDQPGMTCELVNLRVAAIGRFTRPELKAIEAGGEEPPPEAAMEPRSVCFTQEEGYVETPVYDRSKLLAGNGFDGPAVLEEFGATSLLFPGQRATVASDGTIVISITSNTESGD
jgi:N-methylhydantoinase A